MAGKSQIEWTEHTWNPIVGCSIVSPGCTNCYAMKMAARIEAMKRSHYDGTTKRVNGNAVWTGKIALAPDHILLEPLRRKKPTTYFVNSMGDLFHEGAPDEAIDSVVAVMALCPQHTFQVLTKRAERMRDYFAAPHPAPNVSMWQVRVCAEINALVPERHDASRAARHAITWNVPLPNVWLGVSTERQQEADERIPLLLQTPAAIRFISAEPLLGPIDLQSSGWTGFAGDGGPHHDARLDWVIVGGESGPGARPMHPDWARNIREACINADIPLFFKQWGSWYPIIDRDNDDPDWRADYTRTNYQPDKFRTVNLAGGFGFHGERVYLMQRYSKKACGRALDGKEHNEFPGPLPSALAATKNKTAQVHP